MSNLSTIVRRVDARTIGIIFRNVWDMNNGAPLMTRSSVREFVRKARTSLLYHFDVAWRAMSGNEMEEFAVIGIDMFHTQPRQICIALSRMASKTGCNSPGDLLIDLEYFGGRSLLLQGLASHQCAGAAR